jgi:chromosome segregation ATPase
MTNDKNKINELVTADDDPTVELETLALKQVSSPTDDDGLLESSANTLDYDDKTANRDAAIAELKSDLKARSETINGLQFDIEQLRAKWTGLEIEFKAREEITEKLNLALESVNDDLARKEKLLKKRDQFIKSLKLEIRQHNDAYEELLAATHAMKIPRPTPEPDKDRVAKEPDVTCDNDGQDIDQLLAAHAGQLASSELLVKELRAQIERTETYTDSLRQQLQSRTSVANEAVHTRDHLHSELNRVTEQLQDTKSTLSEERSSNSALERELERLGIVHAEEIRTVRFELGEAQETMAQNELVAKQLASDLVDTRSFKDELENMLNQSESEKKSRIEQLERENRKLRREIDENLNKLETRGDAIDCLIAELAKKAQQIDSIGEIEGVIHNIDDRMSASIDDRPTTERDRVTRVLIGSIDDQELRFPLFKDRLTIGRTEQNDIQLKASYVSRRHAVIVTDHEKTRVIDWGSKNGVFVNSKRVTEHFLKNGDTVTIGTADFRYEERPKRST